MSEGPGRAGVAPPDRQIPSDAIRDLPQLEKLDLRWCYELQLPPWLELLEERGCAVLF